MALQVLSLLQLFFQLVNGFGVVAGNGGVLFGGLGLTSVVVRFLSCLHGFLHFAPCAVTVIFIGFVGIVIDQKRLPQRNRLNHFARFVCKLAALLFKLLRFLVVVVDSPLLFFFV